MSRIDELIKRLCPDGVTYYELKDVFQRLKGTPITAKAMEKLSDSSGEITVFAGGQTRVVLRESSVPKANIIRIPAVLVQSRGVIDVIYCDRPFTFKNEMWAYTSANATTTKFLYYFLKTKVPSLRRIASARGSLPQISLRDTGSLRIPLPPIEIQKEIVRILDSFVELETELEKELEARKKQYQTSLDKLFFSSSGRTDYFSLDSIITNLRTGLNPRKNFRLNTEGANGFYITVRELNGRTIAITDKTDRIDSQALTLIDRRSHLQAGDLLLSATGTIGNTALVKSKPIDWNIKEGVYAITPDTSRISSAFLMYWFRTSSARIALDRMAEGGTVRSVSMNKLRKLQIPVPSHNEQRRIVSILNKFDTLVYDSSSGIPAEIEARRKQYEYYRDKLLTFKEKPGD